jgi:hypothetical protein
MLKPYCPAWLASLGFFLGGGLTSARGIASYLILQNKPPSDLTAA